MATMSSSAIDVLHVVRRQVDVDAVVAALAHRPCHSTSLVAARSSLASPSQRARSRIAAGGRVQARQTAQRGVANRLVVDRDRPLVAGLHVRRIGARLPLDVAPIRGVRALDQLRGRDRGARRAPRPWRGSAARSVSARAASALSQAGSGRTSKASMAPTMVLVSSSDTTVALSTLKSGPIVAEIDAVGVLQRAGTLRSMLRRAGGAVVVARHGQVGRGVAHVEVERRAVRAGSRSSTSGRGRSRRRSGHRRPCRSTWTASRTLWMVGSIARELGGAVEVPAHRLGVGQVRRGVLAGAGCCCCCAFAEPPTERSDCDRRQNRPPAALAAPSLHFEGRFYGATGSLSEE